MKRISIVFALSHFRVWSFASLIASKPRRSRAGSQAGEKPPRSRHRGHRPALSSGAARQRSGLLQQTRPDGQYHHAERHRFRAGASSPAQVDIYQGGTATIHANVGGSDLIYIAASVDRSTLVLFGQKGMTSFEGLRGKSVATTSVGAFGEIAMRKTAKERGMEIGKDIKLLYHKGPPDALSTFIRRQCRRRDHHAAADRNGAQQRFSGDHRFL